MTCAMCGGSFRFYNPFGYLYIDENDTYPRPQICQNCWLKVPHRKANPRSIEEMCTIVPAFKEQYDEWKKKYEKLYECEGCHELFASTNISRCGGFGKTRHLVCDKCNGTVFYKRWNYEKRVDKIFDNLKCPSCWMNELHKYTNYNSFGCSRCGLVVKY